MMKSYFTMTLCLLILLLAACKQQKTEGGTKLPSTLLQTAKDFNFNYEDVQKRAMAGDYKAIQEFVDFSRKVENYDGGIHAVAILEVLEKTGDHVFGAAISTMKPKLRELVLTRFSEAQSRTEKEALRRPLSEWAPHTLEALKNGTMPPPLQPTEEELKRKMEQGKAPEGGGK